MEKLVKSSSCRIFACALFLSVVPAHAYTSSDTPPAGVRAAAFVYGYGKSIDSTMNSKGALESLSAPMNRSVTFNDFAASEPRLKELQTALNSLEAGLGDNLLHANLYGDVKVNESHYVGALLYGITDRFSLGLIVPVVKREVNVAFRSEVTNNAAAIQSRIGNIPEISPGLEQLKNTPINDQTFIESIFLDNGYQAPSNFRATSLSDAEIESRYRYYNSKHIGLALRGRVQIPSTQHKPDLSNVVDKDIGEGNWALKLASIHEFRLIENHLDWSTSLWGTWRAPQQRDMAFRRNGSTSPLPNLNDPYQVENVRRQRGAQLDFSTGFNLAFFRSFFNLSGNYHYTIKQSDRIWGSRDLEYSSWTQNTATEMHGLEGGVELSTIGLFLRKQFFMPLRVSFAWFQPVAGRNGYYTPYGRFDVVALF